MNKGLNILVKGIIIFKIILSVLLAISFLVVAYDLWAVRNQIEGKELILNDSEKLYSLIATLLAIITTLLVDRIVLKMKKSLLYREWSKLTILIILVVMISIYLKIAWLGISLMLIVSIYAMSLFCKYSRTQNN